MKINHINLKYKNSIESMGSIIIEIIADKFPTIRKEYNIQIQERHAPISHGHKRFSP